MDWPPPDSSAPPAKRFPSRQGLYALIVSGCLLAVGVVMLRIAQFSPAIFRSDLPQFGASLQLVGWAILLFGVIRLLYEAIHTKADEAKPN
jgi:hypothetical protein